MNVSKVLLRATGCPITWDRHYGDHLSHYVSPRPRIEPRLMACQASMLPTPPPGRITGHRNILCYMFWYVPMWPVFRPIKVF